MKFEAMFISIILLTLLCTGLIAFLSYVAALAYKFLLKNDQALLNHFIFLQLSLCIKWVAMVMGGALLLSEGAKMFGNIWENLLNEASFIIFIIAVSCNLYKWVILNSSLYYQMNFISKDIQEARRLYILKAFIIGVSLATLLLLFFLTLTLTSTSAEGTYARDRNLTACYCAYFFLISASFVAAGRIMSKRLSKAYEEIYKEKRSSIIFSTIFQSVTFFILGVRFLMETVLEAEYRAFMTQSL
jgi:hypothetical protein